MNCKCCCVNMPCNCVCLYSYIFIICLLFKTLCLWWKRLVNPNCRSRKKWLHTPTSSPQAFQASLSAHRGVKQALFWGILRLCISIKSEAVFLCRLHQVGAPASRPDVGFTLWRRSAPTLSWDIVSKELTSIWM